MRSSRYLEPMDLRSTWKLLRAGDLRTRLAALRDARPALRLAITGAALDTGVLDALDTAQGVDTLADRLGVVDCELLVAFLETLVAAGLVRRRGDHYRRTARGSVLAADRVARSTYVAFADFHTGLYRELAAQFAGGPGRDDVSRRADVIAGLSELMAPFVQRELTRAVALGATRRVLDVGCGTGHNLATMLDAAPGASGVGVEIDPATADQARARLAGRGEVRAGDAREVLGDDERFDLVLLANVVYYWPLTERVELFTDLARRLTPGGRVMVLTTALTDEQFARHFDLLLRAQRERMELPELRMLQGQLGEAGLAVRRVRRVTPGEPLYSVIATGLQHREPPTSKRSP
jgi:SAM-dependent methyltransferase